MTTVYDVKTFGAVGDGHHDDRDAINDAMVESGGGGIVYFPAGNYAIGGPIILPNDHAYRKLIGCGRSGISGGFNDFLLWNDQNAAGSAPVNFIDGFRFQNFYTPKKGDITQVDSSSASIAPGQGCGCIYLPNTSWVRIQNCEFTLNGGIGVYFPGICNTISQFNLNGNFGGQEDYPVCIGVWPGSGYVGDAKIMGCRHGVVALEAPVEITNMDIERCQFGLQLGRNPLAYWDRNTNSMFGAGTIRAYNAIAKNLIFESNGSVAEGGAFIHVDGGAMTLERIALHSYEQIGAPDFGIHCDGAQSCYFRNIAISGAYRQAGVGITPFGGAKGCIFENVGASGASGPDGTPGVGWMLPKNEGGYIDDEWGAHNAMSNSFIACDTDGAVPFATLPKQMGNTVSNLVAIADSVDPTWTDEGGSNIGKLVTAGGGAHKVLLRWDGTHWRIAG
jgi:hypothetical protein